jgi:hypothetical protein
VDPRTKPSPLFATDEVSWIGLTAGPLAWMLAHGLNYALVPWACGTRHMLPLHLVSLAALLLAILGAGVAWRDWRQHRKISSESADSAGRAHFIALLAFGSCLMFGLVVLIEGLGQFYFDPCQR